MLDPTDIEAGCKRVEEAFLASPLPPDLEEEIVALLAEKPYDGRFLAVRSSGTDEDTGAHSFAGGSAVLGRFAGGGVGAGAVFAGGGVGAGAVFAGGGVEAGAVFAGGGVGAGAVFAGGGVGAGAGLLQRCMFSGVLVCRSV